MGLLFSKQNEDLKEVKRLTELIREQKSVIQNLKITNLTLQNEVADTVKTSNSDVYAMRRIVENLRTSHHKMTQSHVICLEVIAKLVKDELEVRRPSITEVESEVDTLSVQGQFSSLLPVPELLEVSQQSETIVYLP